ncbi:serine hydrolase domain-containing protein [Sphingobacterium gobiense]|uniref:Beta-N-acetylglucosaminidase n=1 Tax=Sphingobacterium gobiense TaxID=1382456 RepID=A0A2S9JLH4_9SPHI|nr:serine hydrolase domain-containing protein [Sphingobacterium gobiense]PRD53958.1 beta-N-acetylglucosaminidase [Sphingobacterium gobiense]
MKSLLTYFCLLLLLYTSRSVAQYKQPVVNKVTMIQNAGGLVPLKRLDRHRIAVVTAFPNKYAHFVNMVERYADVKSFDFNQYEEHTKYHNTIIVVGTREDLRNDLLLMVQQSMVHKKQIIVVRFENRKTTSSWSPDRLQGKFSELVYPEFNKEAQQYAAMSIFGGLAITQGQNKTEQTRLQYATESSCGLDLENMTKKIDAIATEAIRKRATPGLVVMAVKNGQVIFDKAYGTHTYHGNVTTKTSDIFDLASVSKIAGTTPVVMHLQERDIISLDSTLGCYLGQAQETNKKNIPLRSVLLHEAGFTPFIPFYRNLKPGDLVYEPDTAHQVRVADRAYLRNNYYRDVMWPQMMESPVKPAGNYVYSDISMYVMKEIAERMTSKPMEDYVQELLYQPIGMKTAGYNPRQRFAKGRIVPTQHDTVFRKELLQGYVHDEGAAMAGGVAGHAGLFGTANDLAIYGQLLLNRGEYGGIRYFRPETIDLFTSRQSSSSRRGLGFDRTDPDKKKEYPSRLANASVFGHTGYTGTCVWIDPKNQLVYIFLSNRVHPQVSTRLLDLNIRSRIQDVIYEFIKM